MQCAILITDTLHHAKPIAGPVQRDLRQDARLRDIRLRQVLEARPDWRSQGKAKN